MPLLKAILKQESIIYSNENSEICLWVFFKAQLLADVRGPGPATEIQRRGTGPHHRFWHALKSAP
jgi:hypothetical protein